ncbi:MAG: transaldolase family protein [Candidatus Magasanikbacteria bacterium]
MEKPTNLKTKIFLDSGDPGETKIALALLGFLDGQTTNPSLIAKNPQLKEKLGAGERLSSDQINEFYKKVVSEISSLVPKGSVSVEVYADSSTLAEAMIEQAHEMNAWIPNAHIKLPITSAGLETARQLTQEGIRVNMTLCFSQEQAGAVYTATSGSMPGQVYLSPFIGRFDDRGENGMQFIKNVMCMFESSDHHVEVLAASVRTYDHFLYCLALGVDIITAPLKILEQWAHKNMELPKENYVYPVQNLKEIPYQEIGLEKDFSNYNIQHELTDAGLSKFVSDWNSLITA